MTLVQDLTDSSRNASRVFKKATHLTRPARARQDAPFHGQGHSERKVEAYVVGTLSL